MFGHVLDAGVVHEDVDATERGLGRCRPSLRSGPGRACRRDRGSVCTPQLRSSDLDLRDVVGAHRSRSARRWPLAAANARAMPRPMPLVEPVTTAVLPSNIVGSFSRCRRRGHRRNSGSATMASIASGLAMASVLRTGPAVHRVGDGQLDELVAARARAGRPPGRPPRGRAAACTPSGPFERISARRSSSRTDAVDQAHEQHDAHVVVPLLAERQRLRPPRASPRPRGRSRPCRCAPRRD